MGITYVSRTAHEFGALAADVAAAYWDAREVRRRRHWRLVESLDDRTDPRCSSS
jgi:NAD-specific glutamate dehydrogenase